MEEKNQTVVMTETEKAEFDAFRQAKAKKVAEEKARADREMYKQMVDEEIERSIPVLLGISERIKESKRTVMENFKTILEMKSDLFKTKAKDDQRSHTFTNSDERFMDGVRIIEESYQPEVSKQFIRAEIRDNNGMWKPIPLGMTES